MGHENWLQSITKPEIQIALVSVLLASVAILLVILGSVAYIKVRKRAEKVAREEAIRIAKAVAELEACRYLQAEMPALMKEHYELVENSENLPDRVAVAIVKTTEGDVS